MLLLLPYFTLYLNPLRTEFKAVLNFLKHSPTICRSWTFADTSRAGDKYETTSTVNGYTKYMKLKIRAVGPNDFGTYRCVAKNSLGETDGNIKLDGEWHCDTFIYYISHSAHTLHTIYVFFIHFNFLIYCILFVCMGMGKTAKKKTHTQSCRRFWCSSCQFPGPPFFVLIVEWLTCDTRPFAMFWKLHYGVACKYHKVLIAQEFYKVTLLIKVNRVILLLCIWAYLNYFSYICIVHK